jgi:hypothetical protein
MVRGHDPGSEETTAQGLKRGIDGRDIEMFGRAGAGGDLAGATRVTTSNLSIDLTLSPVTLDFMKV